MNIFWLRHIAKHHAGPGKCKLPVQDIKANMGAELQRRDLLNSARDKDDWSASRSGHCIPAIEPRVGNQYEG
jgi:hypothetical protein